MEVFDAINHALTDQYDRRMATCIKELRALRQMLGSYTRQENSSVYEERYNTLEIQQTLISAFYGECTRVIYQLRSGEAQTTIAQRLAGIEFSQAAWQFLLIAITDQHAEQEQKLLWSKRYTYPTDSEIGTDKDQDFWRLQEDFTVVMSIVDAIGQHYGHNTSPA